MSKDFVPEIVFDDYEEHYYDDYSEWWPADGFTIEVSNHSAGHVQADLLQVGIGGVGKTRVEALRALADVLESIDNWSVEKFGSGREHS